MAGLAAEGLEYSKVYWLFRFLILFGEFMFPGKMRLSEINVITTNLGYWTI
jgi:hypothetical protein